MLLIALALKSHRYFPSDTISWSPVRLQENMLLVSVSSHRKQICALYGEWFWWQNHKQRILAYSCDQFFSCGTLRIVTIISLLWAEAFRWRAFSFAIRTWCAMKNLFVRCDVSASSRRKPFSASPLNVAIKILTSTAVLWTTRRGTRPNGEFNLRQEMINDLGQL